jgi:hypothetical protein
MLRHEYAPTAAPLSLAHIIYGPMRCQLSAFHTYRSPGNANPISTRCFVTHTDPLERTEYLCTHPASSRSPSSPVAERFDRSLRTRQV